MSHSGRPRVVRKVASRIVRDLGFAVTEAAEGAEALDMCRQSMPDAVILDWNMPVMNGLDFVKALRREEGGKTPVSSSAPLRTTLNTSRRLSGRVLTSSS